MSHVFQLTGYQMLLYYLFVSITFVSIDCLLVHIPRLTADMAGIVYRS